jgi:ADP-heptose:LPS heptosyltransferase
LDLKYFGFRWWHLFVAKKRFVDQNLGTMNLIIDLQSKLRNTLILKRILGDNFYSSTYRFKFCSKKSDYVSKENISDMTIDNLEKFLKINIKKINYTLSNLDKDYIAEAKRLLPEDNYIGFSVTQGNEYRKKSWPLDKFIELAKKIQSTNKRPVFFIEKSNKEMIHKIKSEIKEALFPELESNLSSPALVTALATRLEKAISIDNGVMHMISLASIPMIVLFGPTNSKKFAPNQKNIKILDSKKMYGVEDVSKIKLDDVLNCL